MKHAANIVICLLAAALLAAPVVWACCATGAGSAPCGMPGMDDSRPMAKMTAAAPCHGPDRISTDCCEVEPAPSAMLARGFEIERLLTVIEAVEPLVTVPDPAEAAARSAPPRSSLLHDLGRYTLFSALLL